MPGTVIVRKECGVASDSRSSLRSRLELVCDWGIDFVMQLYSRGDKVKIPELPSAQFGWELVFTWESQRDKSNKIDWDLSGTYWVSCPLIQS